MKDSVFNHITESYLQLIQPTDISIQSRWCLEEGEWIHVDACEGDLVTQNENPECFNSNGSRRKVWVFEVSNTICGGGSVGSGGNLGDDYSPYDNDNNNSSNTNGNGNNTNNSPNEIITAPTIITNSDGTSAAAQGLISNLNITNQNQIDWINNEDNINSINNIYLFGSQNNWSTEAKNFAKEAIEVLMGGEVQTFNEFQLNEELETNLFKLIDIDCNQIQNWQELVQHNPPQSVNDLDNQHTTLFTDYEIQNLNNAAGKVINLDYFPVRITTLPNNPVTGLQFTADEFLEHIRININDFVDPFWAQFSPIIYQDNSLINNFSINDTDLWLSNDPLGAIVHIEIPADEGTVICTEHSNSNWTFTTIEVPWDDEHPVSGNRDFGYEINPDGSYTFYTRGVDRMTDAYDYIIEIAEDLIQNGTGIPTNFDLFSLTTDPLWESFQNKISDFVNDPSNSGAANVLSPSKSRPDWILVKDVLEGRKPISDLGCN